MGGQPSKRRSRRAGMDREVYAREYGRLIRHLRAARLAAGLTQEEFGARLGVTQAFISKCEHGVRRLDLVELRHFCRGLGVCWLDFLEGLSKDAPRRSTKRGV